MQDNTNASANQHPPAAKDPAEVWWGTASQSQGTSEVAPPVAVEEPWRWRYSAWVGIMYGPIPVGLIIGLPILLALTMK